MTLIAFETFKRPEGIDAFVSTRRKSPLDIAKEVDAAYQATPSSTGALRRKSAGESFFLKKHLLKLVQGD